MTRSRSSSLTASRYFRDVSMFADGPSLVTTVNYSSGGVSLEVKKRT